MSRPPDQGVRELPGGYPLKARSVLWPIIYVMTSGAVALRNLAIVLLIGAGFAYMKIRHHKSEPLFPHWSADLPGALAKSNRTDKPVLVDFNATWCGPCQDLRKEVFESDEFKGLSNQFILVSVDIDQQPGISQEYGVSAIPDVRVLYKGRTLGKVIGYDDPQQFLADMQDALAKKGD